MRAAGELPGDVSVALVVPIRTGCSWANDPMLIDAACACGASAPTGLVMEGGARVIAGC